MMVKFYVLVDLILTISAFSMLSHDYDVSPAWQCAGIRLIWRKTYIKLVHWYHC